MKRFFLLILPVTAMALCISPPAFAQQGKMAVGAHWGIGSGPSFGLGAKVQYGVSDPVRLEASFTKMWGEKEDLGFVTASTAVSDFGVHVHYLISKSANWKTGVKTRVNLYPLAGFGFYTVTAKLSAFGVTEQDSESVVALDIGGGAELFAPNDKVSIFSEMKLGLGDGLSRFTWLCGVAYHF